MRMRGVEPPRAEAHRHLKPARLPIPPHPQSFLFGHFPDNNVPSDTNINDSFRFVKNFSVNPVRNSISGKKYDTNKGEISRKTRGGTPLRGKPNRRPATTPEFSPKVRLSAWGRLTAESLGLIPIEVRNCRKNCILHELRVPGFLLSQE